MFKKLQNKWNVSVRQFWIIFIVFGLTGTTSAFLSASITNILGVTEDTGLFWRILLKFAMLFIGYQVLLLFYAYLLGQWEFFWQYEKKMLQRMRILKKDDAANTKSDTYESETSKSEVIASSIQDPDQKALSSYSQPQITGIAIFASGAGTNAENIISYFSDHPSIKIKLIVSNKPEAGVLKMATTNEVQTLLIEKEKFFTDGYLQELKEASIDFIVLAGFLWKVPQVLINNYRDKIINIHPALLPKHGGKGMYGSKVHEAVIASGETESGITIHYVDEHYDNGDRIFQATCIVLPDDTPDSLANRIHALEYEHFPRVIEQCVLR